MTVDETGLPSCDKNNKIWSVIKFEPVRMLLGVDSSEAVCQAKNSILRFPIPHLMRQK